MLATNAMRGASFQACIGAILTTGTVLGNLGLSATQQNWTSYIVLAATLQVGYTPFLFAHATQDAPSPTLSRSGSDESIGMPSMDASMSTYVAPKDNTIFMTRL